MEKQYEKELAINYKIARDNVKKELADLEQKGLLTAAEMNKKSRLLQLKRKIEEEFKKVTDKTNKTLRAQQIDLYATSYAITAQEINTTVQTSVLVTVLPTKQIEKSIINKLDKVGFIKRNTNNTKEVVKQLNRVITTGLIQGKGYAQIATKIDDRFNIGYNNSVRIARTEGHRVREAGTYDSMKNAQEKGVRMKKKWLSARDNRVRDDHVELNGTILEMNEDFEVNGETADKPGNFGVPKQDINCRCTLVTIVEY